MKPSVLIAAGVFLLVGAVYALTGPGRIDIIDGQYRFEVARNLFDGGTLRVYDKFLEGAVEGIAGFYSPYGISGSVTPLPLIALARAFGPASIDRQQFFFSFTSAILGAATSALLFLFYRVLDVQPRLALMWTLVAAFATLSYPTATTTFDQTQHGFFVLLASFLAFIAGRRDSMPAAIAAGASLAVLVNFQETYVILFPTLGLATLAAPGAAADVRRRGFERFAAMILVGCVGLLVWAGVNQVRFGSVLFSGKGQNHPPVFGNPAVGLSALLFSPGKSILLYSPPTLLAIVGVYHLLKRERRLASAIVASSGAYIGLISTLTFFGGDWCWGPRYFAVILPLLALGLAFVRSSGSRERALTRAIIAAGVVVQLMGISLDHHRFFYARSLPPFFWYEIPNFYFHDSALVARAAEAADSIRHGVPPEADRFRPGPHAELLTYAVFGNWGEYKMPAPQWMRRFSVFWLPRPWPLWMAAIPEAERPIDPAALSLALLIMGLVGTVAIRQGLRSTRAAP